MGSNVPGLFGMIFFKKSSSNLLTFTGSLANIASILITCYEPRPEFMKLFANFFPIRLIPPPPPLSNYTSKFKYRRSCQGIPIGLSPSFLCFLMILVSLEFCIAKVFIGIFSLPIHSVNLHLPTGTARYFASNLLSAQLHIGIEPLNINKEVQTGL